MLRLLVLFRAAHRATVWSSTPVREAVFAKHLRLGPPPLAAQVSADSTTWTDVYNTTVGASYSVTDEKFAKTTARYVRMNGTQWCNANGYSLFAFMVLNDG